MFSLFKPRKVTAQPEPDFAAWHRRRDLDVAEAKVRILREGGGILHDSANALSGYGLAMNQLEWDGLVSRGERVRFPPPDYSFGTKYVLTEKGRAMAVMMQDAPA